MINNENNTGMGNYPNGENNLQNSANTPQQGAQNGSQNSQNQNQQSTAYVVNEPNPYQQYNQNPYGAQVNSMSYDPGADKKKKRSKKILTAVISILCVAAIATTCVVGYSLITTGNIGTSASGVLQSSDKDNSGKDEEPTAEAATNRDDLPSIYQLSAPSDALSIPEIVEKCSSSVVGISCIFQNAAGTGTGIVMSEDGYIITNAHVVSGATDISVVFTDNPDEGYEAELIGIDSQTDLAVIKIDKDGLTAAEFGKSSELKVGEAAIAIGNPLGFELAGSVTSGIISAVDRELTIEDRTLTLIQTDASINSGNSGGALLNAYGQVIGITSAKINSAYGEGLGFAIPIDEATPIIDDLIQYGYVKGRPLLGLSGRNISSFYSEYYGIPQGFQVEAVEEGSAAEKAGIKQGDIIVGIQGELITSMEEFNEIKEQYQAGDTITISLYRNGQRTDVEATLDEDTGEIAQQQTTEAVTEARSFGGFGF